jgi:hypothetical protein
MRTESAFILEHYLTSKSFGAVSEAFSSAHHVRELSNKTAVPDFNKILGHGQFCCDKCSSSYKTGEVTAVLISGSRSSAATGHKCKNSISHWFCCLLCERDSCVVVRVAF